MSININMPICTCGSATPGAHGPGCPRQGASNKNERSSENTRVITTIGAES